MSFKITITLEGEVKDIPDELYNFIRAMNKQNLQISEQSPQIKRGRGIALKKWTPDEFQTLWQHIRNEARLIMVELAKKPNGYSSMNLQQSLSLGGLSIGGRLSSVGHQIRKLGFENKESLFRRDPEQSLAYVMPEYVALYILALAEKEDAS